MWTNTGGKKHLIMLSTTRMDMTAHCSHPDIQWSSFNKQIRADIYRKAANSLTVITEWSFTVYSMVSTAMFQCLLFKSR